MNELKRKGTRTREQLTFSDSYLVFDNLRNYDFDLVSFYVTFNQYIDRRNYEGKAENSLIFINNEALFDAFNVSRNRFYRLLRLAYECGLIDIEKGDKNRNIYILNDAIPLQSLKKIRNWEDRNKNNLKHETQQQEKSNENEVENQTDKNEEQAEKMRQVNKKKKSKIYRKISYPKKGQQKKRQSVVPKRDNQSSQKGTTSYPEKGQQGSMIKSSKNKGLNDLKNPSNNSNILIDLNINNKSICQSINTIENIDNKYQEDKDKIDRHTDISNHNMVKYREIIKKCDIVFLDKNYQDAVIHVIESFFWDIENKEKIKLGNNIIPVTMLERDLGKLNFEILQHAIEKFKQASREKEIRNTIAYLRACIYHSIHEMSLEIDSNLRYHGLI